MTGQLEEQANAKNVKLRDKVTSRAHIRDGNLVRRNIYFHTFTGASIYKKSSQRPSWALRAAQDVKFNRRLIG